MKRFLVGAGWAFLLWFGGMFVGGTVVGAIAGASVADPSLAAQAGQEAGSAFGLQYGNVMLLVAIAVSALGTVTRWLPGTKDGAVPSA